MAWVRTFGVRCRCVARGTKILLCLAGALVTCSGALVAAQDVQTSPDEPIHTLHVYTNLIQIPTLVLGPYRDRITKPIDESRFSVSIDSGRWFRATHVRQEGDDPISLSILLDVTGDAAELMPRMADALADLVPLSLHSVDHLSIFAMDCSLVRSWRNVPADHGELNDGVESALQSWVDRRRSKHGSKCEHAVHLWDAVAYIVAQEYQLPGRRVILVASDGRDKGSGHTWNEVRAFAQKAGVAIFGLRYLPIFAANNPRVGLQLNNENSFASLCELSGGMVFFTSTESLGKTLGLFTTMLRERYIVEFPRPSNSTAGEHNMQVKIAKGGTDFVRSTGLSVPIPDSALLNDPTTVRSDPSLTPEMGTRHTLNPPQ
jgi:hypothetical protein